MPETIETKDLYKEIKAMRKDLDYIKKHMVDADTILTKEEEAQLNSSIEDYKKGNVVSLDEFERNKNA